MFVATVACFGYAYALFFAETYIYVHLHQIPVSSVLIPVFSPLYT